MTVDWDGRRDPSSAYAMQRLIGMKDRWLGTTKTLEQDIRRVSDAKLWQFRTAASTYHLSPQSSAILLDRGTNCQQWQTALTEAK
jgi:hypothetical protein